MTTNSHDGDGDQVQAGEARSEILAIMGAPLVARALSAVAELSIPDLLLEKPRTSSEIANVTGADARSVYRVMRLLASLGFFQEDDGERFHNTAKVEPLLTDAPNSIRPIVLPGMQDLLWDAQRQLSQTIRTGTPGFELARGGSFFEYLSEHQDAGDSFAAAMAVSSRPENLSVIRSYDFDDHNVVVDIGGGKGGFLADLLSVHPRLKGVLFDQPQVVAEPVYLKEANLLGRCRIESGDFFDSIPGGGDLYFLKRILHDWDDPTVLRILRNCRSALEPGARLLAVEAVVKPGNSFDFNKQLDVSIMTLLRGRERTAAEFHDLFQMAGFQMTGIIEPPPPSTLSIIEGIPI